MAVALLAAAGCGGGDESSGLKGVGWKWSGVRVGEGLTGLIAIRDPDNYLLRLDQDGSFVGRADCKSVAGTYSLSGSKLTLELKPPAKGACGKGSRADQYIALLRRVATYDVYAERALSLGLEDDTASMYFYSRAG